MYTKPLSFGRSGLLFRERKGLKGQTEIIIILAIAIVSITIALIVSQTLVKPEPANIANLKKLVKSDIERAVQNAAEETVIRIGRQGGYYNAPPNNINFAGSKVAYWGLCQKRFIPSLDRINEEIKLGLENRLKDFDFSPIKKSYGKEIKIEPARRENIEVLIRDQDIAIDVYMKTSLEGFDLMQPYKINVPVSFRRAYDFASDFVQDNSKKRHLDIFISSLMYHTNPRFFPTLGMLSKCGDSIFRTRDDLEKAAEKIVDFAASKILLWQQPPIGDGKRLTFAEMLETVPEEKRKEIDAVFANITEEQREDLIQYTERLVNPPPKDRKFLEYYIPDLNNKTYPDLEIKFHRGSEVSQKNFQPSQNAVSITNAKPLHQWIPFCLVGFDIEYSLNMPIVATVKSGDFELNFGTLAYIDNNEIGNCDVIGNFTEIEDPCGDRKCPVKISVSDSGGTPIPDTKVSAGPCLLGLTDQEGIVEAHSACGISELNVYNPQYGQFFDVVSMSDLNKNVVLKKNPIVIFNFNKAVVNAPYPFTEAAHKEYNPGFQPRTSDDRKTLEFPFAIDLTPETADSISVTFEPKTQRPWNQIEIVVANGGQTLLDDIEPIDLSLWQNQESTIEGNLITTYKNGTATSNIVEFPLTINASESEAKNIISLRVANPEKQNIIRVELQLDASDHKFVDKSNTASITSTIFSATADTEILGLLWSNATQDGFIKPGESAIFTAAIISNATADVAGEEAVTTPQKQHTAQASSVIDYLSPQEYTAEVTTTKKVTYRKKICKKFSAFQGCRRYQTLSHDFLIKGITRFDFEVKEEDSEYYVNAFVPSFKVTGLFEKDEFDFSTAVPIFKQHCKIEPVNREKPTSCKFTDSVPITYAGSIAVDSGLDKAHKKYSPWLYGDYGRLE